MKSKIYLFTCLITLLSFTSCENDDIIEDDLIFEYDFTEPYTTGIIKFQYQKLINGLTTTKDTIVSFNSSGNNPDYHGYSKPSTPWVTMSRFNPYNIYNRSVIFFTGTNLNLLTMPYTFNHHDINMDAQINYVIDEKIIIDSSGQQFAVSNTYAATTYHDNFELTILSKENNRLQGTFKGEIENQDGDIIDIKKGIFDIQIVER